MKAYSGDVGTAPLGLYLSTERVRVVSFEPPLFFPNLPYLYSTNAACFIIQNSTLSEAAFLNLGSAKSCQRPPERRKCVMAVQFHWRSQICMYNLNFVLL